MDRGVLLFGAGAVIFLLFSLLFVVGYARSLDGKYGKTAVAAAPPVPDDKKKAKGGVGGIVAIAAALFGGGGALFGALNDRNSDAIPVSREISAGALKGTMISPRKRADMVLIVPGSGPTDRNGNNPLGVKSDTYRLLAEGLFAQGIGSVRVDKRGMYGSSGAGDPNAVSIEQYAQDYRAWIDAIRAETVKKCVWLLGHSEGAIMVSAAAEGRRDVCGLILVSGPGRKLGDILRAQLRANPANGPILPAAEAAIAELEAGRRVDVTNMHPALAGLFAPQVQPFLISLMAVDPVELLRKARKKTLIIQGSTDLQVSLEDADLLNKAPRTRLRVIEGMNHVLKIAPADRAANLATYTDANLPLAPRLVERIEDFIDDD